MSTIYTVCNRHDENLLSLYQEAKFLGHTVVPFYHTKYDNSFQKLYDNITCDDYLIILHTSFGSHLLSDLISKITCKKILNHIAFNYPLIGNKFFQQKLVRENNPLIIIDTYTKKDATNITSPFIAKPVSGSCGQGIALLNNHDFIKNAPDDYIFQPYIPNDGDWRVVVVGGKSISAIKRLGKIGQATNNIATGSFAIAETNKKILDEIYPLAESISKCFGFDYVGVDIIKDVTSNRYYFLECNERPTFETSQILTGKNIAHEIIKELVK